MPNAVTADFARTLEREIAALAPVQTQKELTVDEHEDMMGNRYVPSITTDTTAPDAQVCPHRFLCGRDSMVCELPKGMPMTNIQRAIELLRELAEEIYDSTTADGNWSTETIDENQHLRHDELLRIAAAKESERGIESAFKQATEELAALKADLERHVRMAAEGATRSEQLRDALDHIMRTANHGIQPTRRLDWIALRAKYALERELYTLVP